MNCRHTTGPTKQAKIGRNTTRARRCRSHNHRHPSVRHRLSMAQPGQLSNQQADTLKLPAASMSMTSLTSHFRLFVRSFLCSFTFILVLVPILVLIHSFIHIALVSHSSDCPLLGLILFDLISSFLPTLVRPSSILSVSNHSIWSDLIWSDPIRCNPTDWGFIQFMGNENEEEG